MTDRTYALLQAQQLTEALKEREELRRVLEEVLETGLNGGNNVRLAFVAAGGKPLGKDDLLRAERSEKATQEAFALIEKARIEGLKSQLSERQEKL